MTDQDRIAAVERDFVAFVGRSSRPSFWHDREVRRFLTEEHNNLTLDAVRAQVAVRFGPARTPSRSAIHRFWQNLDRFWSKRS